MYFEHIFVIRLHFVCIQYAKNIIYTGYGVIKQPDDVYRA
jgi:hypothetical protein